MDKKLLLKMLPGFMPLVVFIVADEIWGTEIGLIVAIVCGIVPLIYGWVKNRVIDKFILFDTLLIIVLGVISIFLANEVFFKLKPALIGVLLTTFLGISVYTPANLVLGMSKRYIGEMNMNQDQVNYFKKTLKLMFFVFALHTLLIFYSVWYMSKEAWAFISGGLFYILFGIVFLLEFIRTKVKQSKLLKEEHLPILNRDGDVIGSSPKRMCIQNKELLHPVIHLHLLNNKKQLYLQKNKFDKWNSAFLSCVALEDTIESKIKREVYEEFGIERFDIKFVEQYIYDSDIDREYLFLFICIYNSSIQINPSKLEKGKFWTVTQIKSNLEKDIFTSNFETEFSKLLDLGFLK